MRDFRLDFIKGHLPSPDTPEKMQSEAAEVIQ